MNPIKWIKKWGWKIVLGRIRTYVKVAAAKIDTKEERQAYALKLYVEQKDGIVAGLEKILELIHKGLDHFDGEE